jgi:accessory gene regulator B
MVVGDLMKKKFLIYSTGLIKQYYPEIDDIKMEEYRYNLEGFYLTISKMLIIFPLAIIIGVFKEMIILLVFYNLIRETAHGLHASKSWICLISSAIIFIGCPLLAKIITIPFIYQIILEIIGLILIALYAPADTKKAPIIKKVKRKKLKIHSIINCLFLIIINLFIKNSTISNIIIISIWIGVFLILPISYKLFNQTYNNYIEYLKNMN